MASRVVVLDANVLYGIEATDLLLTMATHHLFRPHWSPQILDEVSRNLKLRSDLDPASVERRIAHMNRALPAAIEEPPASLIDQMPVNDKDRHVLALAVHVQAPVIVTENLRDFPPKLISDHGVEAIDTDTFVLGHAERDPASILGAVDAMVARRRRYPRTRQDIVDVLRSQLPQAMAVLSD